MQPAHGDEGAGGGRGGEGPVVVVALAQTGEELADVALPHVLGALHPQRGEVGRPARQVAAVGAQGVPGRPRSTSRWVSHPSTARPTGWGGPPACCGCRSGQDLVDADAVHVERLGDGPVGDVAVMRVQAPREGGSARMASFQPFSASSVAYDRVALVSAHVDVCGTAPGMLATQ